jgi:multidrug resistance efflux pump
VIGTAIALSGVFVVLYIWGLPPFTGAIQSTDDAYVRGLVTTISPQVSGYVTEVAVRDYQPVAASQVLVTIDDRIYRQRVEQAQANLHAAQANLANSTQAVAAREAGLQGQRAQLASAAAQLSKAEADMRRADALIKDGWIANKEMDQTRAALLQAQAAVRLGGTGIDIARQDVKTAEVNSGSLRAQVESATAALRLAEIDLSNTVIRAPKSGRLSDVGVRLGQYVTAGSQLLFLVPDQMWVVANYKERQTARMAPGQKARLTVDALPGVRFSGRVEVISPASGSEFSVLKPDNATGNFVKVAQRIPVLIALDPGQADLARLRVGMSVTAEVDTASGARR